MKFSTRTTYGLRAMIFLASEKNNVSIAKIAEEENISLKYLEKIFVILKKNNLVTAQKGANGGYILSRLSENINILEIVEALEGKISPFHCLDKNGKIHCSAKCTCGATRILIKVQNAINTTLKSMNLKDLL